MKNKKENFEDMSEEKYWNDEYWKQNLERNKDFDFLEDLWLEKYSNIFNDIPKGKALDLGCGLGQFTKYLFLKGFDVISADISENALNKLKEKIPNSTILKVDMSKPLPFEDKEFELVLANLSIHYFDENTTKKLLQEIKRILKPNGYFIGSVNSSKGFSYIKNEAKEIEPNYYFAEGRPVRLFDEQQFQEYFKDFNKVELKEVETTRWNRKKYMYEFIYRNK